MRGRSQKKKSLGLKKSWSVRGYCDVLLPWQAVPGTLFLRKPLLSGSLTGSSGLVGLLEEHHHPEHVDHSPWFQLVQWNVRVLGNLGRLGDLNHGYNDKAPPLTDQL